MGRLVGKTALVTGAASGIGRACALRMAAEGARVVVTDLDEAGARSAAAEAGDALPLALDVASESAWIAALAQVGRWAGRLDALVNNAGVGIGGDITQLSLDDWRRQQAVNLDGAFLGVKHALPRLRASGGGAIVNIASVTAVKGSGTFVSYAAAKGGVRAFTRAVAKQCAMRRDGVRVNAVLPGMIDTPIFGRLEGVAGDAADPAALAERLVALGRLGRPDDIAHAVVYLVSDEAAYVTGAELAVDGGLLIQ